MGISFYPYFHDGQVKTLDEAVEIMAWVQLNRKFSDEGRAKVVAFLASDDSGWLTGEVILASGGLR